jgi:hypothetical protein
MQKHSMLDPKLRELFDFAAANPMQGTMMTSQMTMPAVFLQMMESHEQDMHRFDQMLAGDAEKAVQVQHEERTDANVDSVEGGEGFEQETESTSFTLVYYNPGTEEAQVIKEEVQAKISDYEVKEKKGKGAASSAAQLRAADYMLNQAALSPSSVQAASSPASAQAMQTGAQDSAQASQPPQLSQEQLAARTAMSIDQSVGQKSTYPIYANVAAPLVMSVVDPIRLEIALKKIEVQSPKPFGGAAGVSVAPQVFNRVEQKIQKEGIEAEIVPVDRLHPTHPEPSVQHPEIVAVENLRNLEAMRAETLHQIDVQIKAFEHVIEELEVTDKPMRELLKLLPPLSKARYLALLEHDRKIAETLVVDLLIADLEFLVIVKKAIKTKGLRGLVETLKKLGKLAAVIQKSGGGGDGDDDEDEGAKIIPIKKGSGAKPPGLIVPGRGKKGGKKGAGENKETGGRRGAGLKGKAGNSPSKAPLKKRGKHSPKPSRKEGILGKALRKLSGKKRKKD